MQRIKQKPDAIERVDKKQPIWHAAATSLFGAAVRLHRYRDARDTLLRHLLREQETRSREAYCCDE